MPQQAAPKAFISYAWTTEQHKDWVRALAERLMDNGVEVILDQWDLSAGHDAYVFMEQMVSDPNVTKVIIVCDRAYVEKAKSRKGGVGTEAQILSPELYSKAHDQDKFVVVSRELDTDGEPCRPVFYKSRIYISMIEEESFESQYEELLRWTLGQPFRVKPKLGKPPAFITNPSAPSARTSMLAEQIAKGPKRGTSDAGSASTFLDAASEELRGFKPIADVQGTPFDDLVWSALEEMLPLANRVSDVFKVELGRSQNVDDMQPFLRFIERCADLSISGDDWFAGTTWSLDHQSFFAEELLCRFCSLALAGERFDVARLLLDARYATRLAKQYNGPKTVGFESIQWHQDSLEKRNQRLQTRRLSLKADLLKQRTVASPLSFEELMQGDFVLFLGSTFKAGRLHERWWPNTLVYATHFHEAFPLFVRSESKAYAGKFATVFGLSSGKALKDAIEGIPLDRESIPRWHFDSIDLRRLSNFDNLLSFN